MARKPAGAAKAGSLPPRDRGFEPSSQRDPFGFLVAEHALLRQELGRALALADRDGNAESARTALEALAASLRLHLRREERALLPMCEQLFGGKDGAAAVMRHDHTAILRDLTLLVNAAAEGFPEPPRSRLERLQGHLGPHFQREERVLFPLMAAILAPREAVVIERRLRDASGR